MCMYTLIIYIICLYVYNMYITMTSIFERHFILPWFTEVTGHSVDIPPFVARLPHNSTTAIGCLGCLVLPSTYK